MLLKKSFLQISCVLLLGGHLFASVNELSFLLMPQNVANPGYASHSSSLSGFAYNPAIVPKNGSGSISSVFPLYADLLQFTLGGQYVTENKDCWGAHVSFLHSDPVPIYEIDNYFDPQLVGEERLEWLSLSLQYAPSLRWYGWNIGFSGKVAYEHLPGLRRAALLFQAGVLKRIRTGLQLGVALSDFGITFYSPDALLPIHLDATLHQKLMILGKNKMDIYLGARYILPDNFRTLAGLEYSRVFPFIGFSVKSDFQYGLGTASSLQDGVSVGGSVWMTQWFKTEFQYLLKFSSSGWTHQFGLVYGLVGRP